MHSKSKSPEYAGKRYRTQNHTPNADFPDSFPLHLRPEGQGHNHSALRSASALMPQNKAGRNRFLSIDAGGTL